MVGPHCFYCSMAFTFALVFCGYADRLFKHNNLCVFQGWPEDSLQELWKALCV